MRRRGIATLTSDVAYVRHHQAVTVQARTEVVRAFTTWPTTNHGWRLMNTAAFTMKGAVNAIHAIAAKRSAPTQPPANTPPIRATKRKTVAMAMHVRIVTADESV